MIVDVDGQDENSNLSFELNHLQVMTSSIPSSLVAFILLSILSLQINAWETEHQGETQTETRSIHSILSFPNHFARPLSHLLFSFQLHLNL